MKKIIKHYPMTDRLIVRGGYIKNGHGNFLMDFFSLFFSCLMLGKAH